ncbi:hypothetical protein [Alkaliphilus flagellatus]|nr:hypothetical protein [Alkaliphilus flagellatus]
MEDRNKLNEIPLANVNREELRQIQELEQTMGDKYYLIALEKKS